MSEAPKMPPLPEPHAEIPHGRYYTQAREAGTLPIFTADQMRAAYLSGWRAAREEAARLCQKEAASAREAKAWLGVFAADECETEIRSMPDPVIGEQEQPVHQTADSGEGRMSDALKGVE